MTYGACALHAGYLSLHTHTLRIFMFYGFSTPIIDALTRLNVVMLCCNVCHMVLERQELMKKNHCYFGLCLVAADVKGNRFISSSSIGTTAHCGLWPVEKCPSIFSYLPPTLSIFSFPAHEDLFLLPISILSWIFPFFSSLPVLE